MTGKPRGLRLPDAEEALVDEQMKLSGAKSFNAFVRELIREALIGRGIDVDGFIEGRAPIAKGIDAEPDTRPLIERLTDLEHRVSILEDR